MKNKRQSGRTTRMLQAAAEYAQSHGESYVVAYKQQWPYLKDLLREHVGDITQRGENTVFLSVGYIRFITPYDVRENLQHGRIIGQHTNNVFADHHTLEQEMGWMLEELTRYDEEEK